MGMQCECATNKPLDWTSLGEDYLNYLRDAGYRPGTVDKHRRVLRRLILFAGNARPSLDVVRRFLESYGLPAEAGEIVPHTAQHHRLIVNGVRGFLRYARLRSMLFESGPPVSRLPAPLMEVLSDYERYCVQERRYRPDTTYSRIGQVRRFLEFYVGRAGVEIEALRPQHLSEFIGRLQGMAPSSVATYVSTLRVFLHYLWAFEVLPEDLSEALPKTRIYRDTRIPWVWPADDVQALLASVDRGSPRGKRNYAILLLAYRLGLRSKDIRELKLENIHWTERRIEITQSKTGALLTLPLVEDVGNAIIDYLQNSRPPSDHREVFLRLRPPFRPLASGTALSEIIRLYRERAGIDIPDYGHPGIHSLRYTLANQMQQADVPLEVIASVLGHATPESTHGYMKVDVKGLRSASLDPDFVSTVGGRNHE